MGEYDFKKPPTSYSIAKWGKNKNPHLFLEQPGISLAFALFQDQERADYFNNWLSISIDGDALQNPKEQSNV